MPRFLLILAWPLIEIGLFVVIGGQIGLWPTLAIVIGTAVFGIILLRIEAQRGAGLLRGGLSGATIRPDAPVAGLMRALAAVLLILPGFLTDFLGLLLLLPPVQGLLKGAVMSRLSVMGASMGASAYASARGTGERRSGGSDPEGETVEGEWIEVPPEHPSASGSSPSGRNRPSRWTETE